jgi:acetylcholinesterase
LSEDCLFINVWAPADATPDSKLPVWLYIQGGGYGFNSNANYNGTKVVQESGREIVFVNINYRVSAYGFLASEKVRNNGALNAGLLDQRKALEWVQKYISLVSHCCAAAYTTPTIPHPLSSLTSGHANEALSSGEILNT